MSQTTFLNIENISKTYPGVQALDQVSMSFRKGEVHAIVGENGAGKSTLIKVLTGAISPDSGNITFENKSYAALNAKMAMDLGIAAIYQEFNLIPFLSVAENVFIGREIRKGTFLDFNAMNESTIKLCKEMELDIDPKCAVKDIGVAYQQIVEIVKAISKDIKLLIMDEPTAPLTNRETDAMFKLINKLKLRGVTILYISHRLEEIFEICDRVSVMRDGKYIITKNTKDTDRKELISFMVGRDIVEDYPNNKRNILDECALEIRSLNTSKLKNINIKLRKGEILGLGGLVGAGRTELARAIFGADPIESGEIMLRGKIAKIKKPAQAIRNGIALIPEDRKNQGLVLGLPITHNITLSSLRKFCSWIFIKNKNEEDICKKYSNELRIKTPGILQLVKNLSGGNQQKVVLAKWLLNSCDILIFDEPTRGIDVGTRHEIYQIMREIVEKGKSIIMISSDMPELIGMSDRIYVMSEGMIAGELERTEFSQESILELASYQKTSEV